MNKKVTRKRPNRPTVLNVNRIECKYAIKSWNFFSSHTQPTANVEPAEKYGVDFVALLESYTQNV